MKYLEYGIIVYEIIIIYVVWCELRYISDQSTSRKQQDRSHEQMQMLSDISHSLQTPLTIMRGELEMLEKQIPNSQCIASINNALHRASECIRRLLHVARLDGDMYRDSFSAVDVSNLVSEQALFCESMAQQQHVRVVSDIGTGIVLWGNKYLLQEMIVVIVHNAIKYRRNNTESVVSISLRSKDRAIYLTIEDNGIGIEHTELPHIFRRLYRGSRGMRHADGTGLGLAIAQKIAMLHKGTITVSSTLGAGTRCEIVFENYRQK